MAQNNIDKQSFDPNWMVSAGPLNGILEVAEHLGANRQALIIKAGLEAALLKLPDRRFPVFSYYRLFELAYQATGNLDIGLAVGRSTWLKGLNLQLYMTKIGRCLRDYLNLMPSLLKLRGDIGQVTAHRQDELVELRWEPLLANSGGSRFISDELLAASAAIVNSLCILPVPIVKAKFSYPRPADCTGLSALFGSDLSFDQLYSSLFIPAQALDYPFFEQEYQVGADVEHPFSEFFEDSEPTDELLNSLKRSIIQHLPEGEVTIDQLASKLNVSRRTLQRRLAERNTSFMTVLQQVRSRVALKYLADERLGIMEIAFLLGYADQGSFSSAFKGWHGLSPRDYRQK